MDCTINILNISEQIYQDSYRNNTIPDQSEYRTIKIINLKGQTKAYFLKTQQIIFPISLKNEEYLMASDFGIENDDCLELYNFIIFMYQGMVYLKPQNSPSLFYQYFLLGIKFKVNELVDQLMRIGQEQVHLLFRSAFLNSIVLAYQNTWFKEKYASQEKMCFSFISTIIKTNMKLLEDGDHNKIVIIQNAFTIMEPLTFQWILQLVKINSQKPLESLQNLFLNFKNAKCLVEKSYSEGELIFVQEAVNLYDEKSFNIFKKQLRPSSINFIRQSVERKLCFHFVQNVSCNSEQQYFQASCGHFICLRCFSDYFAFKSKLLNPDKDTPSYPHKIRCLSRHTDPSLCDYVYDYQEFLKIKNLQNHPIMNIYLQ